MSGGASASSDAAEQPPPRRGLAGFAARAIVWLRFLIVPAWIALAVVATVKLPSISETGGGGVGSMVPEGLPGRRHRGRRLPGVRHPGPEPQRRRPPGSPWPARRGAEPGDRLPRPAQPPAGTDRRPARCASRAQPEAAAGDAGERHRGARAAVPRSGARYRRADGAGGQGLPRARGRSRPRQRRGERRDPGRDRGMVAGLGPPAAGGDRHGRGRLPDSRLAVPRPWRLPAQPGGAWPSPT